ncbi:MAG: EAL domain-containing protein [Actinomycetes bacterium]
MGQYRQVDDLTRLRPTSHSEVAPAMGNRKGVPVSPFAMLAGLELLISTFRFAFAVLPPAPQSPQNLDFILGLAFVLLAAFTFLCSGRQRGWLLDASVAIALLLMATVVGLRPLAVGQILGSMSILLLVLYAAYFRPPRQMWSLLTLGLVSFGAALVINPESPSPLFFLVAATSTVAVAKVVSSLGIRLRSQMNLLTAVLDASPDQILQYDRACRVEYANDAAEASHGNPSQEWIGHTLEELGFPDREAAPLRTGVAKVIETGARQSFENFHDSPEGRRYFEVNLSPVLGPSGYVEHVMADNRDITRRRASELELTTRATHDPLTGLANREALFDDIDRALAADLRTHLCVGLLMIDIDHFKNVNDSLGHLVGDQLLVAAAARFKSIVRAGDMIARVGGDEFVVVLRDLEGIEEALGQAQRLIEAFRVPLHVEGHSTFATISVGVTVSALESTSGDLLREADTALFVAKDEGRDRVAAFNSNLKLALTERLQVESDLRPALELGQFAVWYQPQVNLLTGQIESVEALLRWNHPSGHVLDAERFIDAAESNGMLDEIGQWVLQQACDQVAQWNAVPGARQLTVGVNMSAHQLADPDLFARTHAAIGASGLDPKLLCIEVTETTLLIQTEESRDNLRLFGEAGIQLAIDDFGTGYASLAYLREIHADVLKIDRSFVSDITANTFDSRLVAGIIALAERLGITVIAEGVETQLQASALIELGCPVAQGFLYSPALPADELAARYGQFLLEDSTEVRRIGSAWVGSG